MQFYLLQCIMHKKLIYIYVGLTYTYILAYLFIQKKSVHFLFGIIIIIILR